MQNSHSKTSSIAEVSTEKMNRIIEAYEELTPDVLINLLLEFSLMQRIYLLSVDAENMCENRRLEFEGNMFLIERLLRAAA